MYHSPSTPTLIQPSARLRSFFASNNSGVILLRAPSTRVRCTLAGTGGVTNYLIACPGSGPIWSESECPSGAESSTECIGVRRSAVPPPAEWLHRDLSPDMFSSGTSTSRENCLGACSRMWPTRERMAFTCSNSNQRQPNTRQFHHRCSQLNRRSRTRKAGDDCSKGWRRPELPFQQPPCQVAWDRRI